ncbi:CPBP family intramembrane glutamic endopeptidase [Neobacillus rhizosphaerae]|uniref:CPBP family intramembrane glutamic endopeptidase n=1 Tax=Neobacillus rhizosphaerae TaxID=2880965 RepID=UPI003D2CD866
MQQNFIKMNQGKNNWKRFLLSFVIIILFIFVGSIMYIFALSVFAETDGNPNSYFDRVELVGVHVNPLYDFVLTHINYVFWMLGLVITMRLVHKRAFKSLITPNKKINWRRIFWGFSLFFCLVSGTTLLDFILNPGDYAFNNIKFRDFLQLFFFVLILTPLQTTAEEVFFRGYLMQWFGRKITYSLLLSIIVGSIFGMLHFSNPEMNYSAFFVGSDYVLSGIVWCYVTAKTNSAEITIGAHAANNMFLGWFLTMDDAVFGKIPSLFVVTNINPQISLLWTIITLAVFSFLAIKKYGKNY